MFSCRNGLTHCGKRMHSYEYLITYRTKPCAFSKGGEASITEMMSVILNMPRKTLQMELELFNKTFGTRQTALSKQAFSQKRQCFKAEGIREFVDTMADCAYRSGDIKRYKGYRLFAIDGLILQVPTCRETREYFGCADSATSKRSRALASLLCDVQDELILDAEIAPSKIGERELAVHHLDKFTKYAQEKDVIIMDRGYPAYDLIERFLEKKVHFLMRVSKGFNIRIDQSNQTDFWLPIKRDEQEYALRVIKFMLPSGVEEVLITTLPESDFPTDAFPALYFKRWPIEKKIDTIKNKLLIEDFSGRLPIAIEQDFYATIFLSMVVTATKAEADAHIQRQDADLGLTHAYQANEKILIGLFKERLIRCFLEDDADLRVCFFDDTIAELIHKAVRYKSPIRPERTFQRPTAHLAKPKHPKRAI